MGGISFATSTFQSGEGDCPQLLFPWSGISEVRAADSYGASELMTVWSFSGVSYKKCFALRFYTPIKLQKMHSILKWQHKCRNVCPPYLKAPNDVCWWTAILFDINCFICSFHIGNLILLIKKLIRDFGIESLSVNEGHNNPSTPLTEVIF